MSTGLTRTGFSEDLKLGQEVEGELARALLTGGTGIEVKSDRRARETGNIFVEFEYRGKPSGIASSPAEWWVYEIEGRFFVMPIRQLKSLAKRAYIEGRVVAGGDFDRASGVLIPVEWLVWKERRN